MWVGGLADSQTRSKPFNPPPQITPKIAFFDPKFTFNFSKSHKNPGVGGWVHTFGKTFPNETVFFGKASHTCIVYQSHLFPAPWAPPAPTHRTDWCGAGQSDSSPQRNYISWNNKSSLEETHGRPCHYSGHIAEQASGIEHPRNLFPWDIRPAAGIKLSSLTI